MTPSQVKLAAIAASKMTCQKLSLNVENISSPKVDVSLIPLPSTPYPGDAKSRFTFDDKCYSAPSSFKCLTKDESCYQLSSLDLLQKSYCDSSSDESEVRKDVKSSLKRKRSPEREEGEISSPETTPIWKKSQRLSLPASLQTPLRSQKRRFSALITPPESSPYSQLRPKRRFLPPYDGEALLEAEGSFIDTHCHLDFLTQREGHHGTYHQFRESCQDTFPKSYEGCLAIFCNPLTFEKTDVWSGFLGEAGVWGGFGCHPHHAYHYGERVEAALLEALQHPSVRALGEIGLDYSNRNGCSREVQWAAFRRQLQIGLDLHLPIVLHCREAHTDAIRIAKEVLPLDHPLHLHCFTDEWEWASEWLTSFPRLLVGLTPVVTFPSAESVHRVAATIPLDRLLLETDAPYFLPRQVKSRRLSHPGMAIHVAAQVAAIRRIPLQEVLKVTRQNTRRLYGI